MQKNLFIPFFHPFLCFFLQSLSFQRWRVIDLASTFQAKEEIIREYRTDAEITGGEREKCIWERKREGFCRGKVTTTTMFHSLSSATTSPLNPQIGHILLSVFKRDKLVNLTANLLTNKFFSKFPLISLSLFPLQLFFCPGCFWSTG